VLEVTGKPAEPFETTVRAYASKPEVQRTARAFGRALGELMLAPLWRGYDHDAYERQLGLPRLKHPLYAMEDVDLKANHSDPDDWARYPGSTVAFPAKLSA
jgi:NAD(P)H dehydrogenase (quinone)